MFDLLFFLLNYSQKKKDSFLPLVARARAWEEGLDRSENMIEFFCPACLGQVS